MITDKIKHKILDMKDTHNLTFAEVSDELGISERSAKTHYHKTKNKILKKLADNPRHSDDKYYDNVDIAYIINNTLKRILDVDVLASKDDPITKAAMLNIQKELMKETIKMIKDV